MIQINGRTVGISNQQGTGTYILGLNGFDTVNMLAGQTVGISVFQNSGGTRALHAGFLNTISVTREGN